MRNPLTIFFHWQVPPSSPEELATADFVISHEFGDQKNVNSSTSGIVKVALEMSDKYGIPLVCQSPGHRATRDFNAASPVAVIYRHGVRPGAYLDTHEVNRQAVDISRGYGWRRVIVCAHPHHLWRAGEDLRRQGLTPLYPDMSKVGYDPTCSRPALRTPWIFIPREILARLQYLMNGWL